MKRMWTLSGLFLSALALTEHSVRAEPGIEKVSAQIPVVYAAQPAQPNWAPEPLAHPQSVRQPASTSYLPLDTTYEMPYPAPAPKHSYCKFGVYVDYLHMTVRESVPFGQVINGEGGLDVPFGPVGLIETDYSPGARIGGYVALTGRTDLRAEFLWFDNSNHAALAIPAGQEDLFIKNLLAFPGTDAAGTNSLAAEARTNIRLLQGDLDVRHSFCLGDCYNLALLLGGRFAHLDQEMLATYSSVDNSTVKTSINYDGGGPRIGLEGNYSLYGKAFVYARGNASLLYGRYRATYEQQSVLNGLQAQTNSADNRFLPIIDLELGFGCRWKCIQMTAGYSVATWFNTLTTSSWIQQVQDTGFATNRADTRDTLTFDGFFVRFELKF